MWMAELPNVRCHLLDYNEINNWTLSKGEELGYFKELTERRDQQFYEIWKKEGIIYAKHTRREKFD